MRILLVASARQSLEQDLKPALSSFFLDGLHDPVCSESTGGSPSAEATRRLIVVPNSDPYGQGNRVFSDSHLTINQALAVQT